MEVHHHAHTSGKKWTHYFWEFFMLFVAVTLGFFVENMREHYIEHKRGLQYIRSFVEDLKTDTAGFSHIITQYQVKEAQLDHLYLCHDSINSKLQSNYCINNIYAATIGFQDLIFTDRTLLQLKNAGGLRLLEEQDADSLIIYDQFLRYLLKVESTSLQEMQTRVRDTRNSVFAYSEIMETSWAKGTQPEKVNLISTDKELLNRFFNEVMVYRFACRFQFRQVIKLREKSSVTDQILFRKIPLKIITWKYMLTHIQQEKKWTHYFWEFLMLFLAVFCGFLAENQREHMIENRRVKESMKEVVENLKYDTVRCRLNTLTNVKVALGIDSLRSELRKAISGQVNGNTLYYFILRYTGNFGQAVFNTSAITELKNSGSLRLIENKKIVLSMADYYERKVFAAKDMMPSKEQVDALQKSLNQFFGFLYLDNYIESFNDITPQNYDNTYNYQDILEHKPALQLLNNDPKEQEKLYTQISQFEMQLKKYNFWLYHNKEAAEKLIKEIQQEYNLSEGTPLEK